MERICQRIEDLSVDVANLREASDLSSYSGVTTAFKPQRYWFIELWAEKRELFKEFLGEVLLIALFLLSVEMFHRGLALTSLEPNQIELLNKTHFYFHYSSLVILSLGFIITVMKSLFRGSKP